MHIMHVLDQWYLFLDLETDTLLKLILIEIAKFAVSWYMDVYFIHLYYYLHPALNQNQTLCYLLGSLIMTT